MIPQTFPKASVDEDRAALEAAFARVLDSGRYILGPEVDGFEAAFAAHVGVAHGIGVANGTDAVEIGLRAIGVRAGDRVATVAHTAVATVTAIRAIGAEPVFVDIDPATYVMDLDGLRAAAKTGLKAVVAVHLYGNMVPPEPLTAICREHGLRLLEDCAQAHGADNAGRRAGSIGDAAAFSFYPTKNLGAIGDGGIVVTADAAVATEARLLREYGWRDRYVSAIEGTNSRLDPMQAAFLSVGLEHLDARNDQRRAIAALYDAGLAEAPVTLPVATEGTRHVYHQYVVRVADRDRVLAQMAEKGVGCGIHYPVPVHRQAAYAAPDVHLPATEAAAAEILSLPMYPQLPHDDARRVVEALREIVG